VEGLVSRRASVEWSVETGAGSEDTGFFANSREKNVFGSSGDEICV